MRWFHVWQPAALAFLLVTTGISQWISLSSLSSPPFAEAAGWTSRRKLAAREEARDLWNHGFNNYMEHGMEYSLGIILDLINPY